MTNVNVIDQYTALAGKAQRYAALATAALMRPHGTPVFDPESAYCDLQAALETMEHEMEPAEANLFCGLADTMLNASDLGRREVATDALRSIAAEALTRAARAA